MKKILTIVLAIAAVPVIIFALIFTFGAMAGVKNIILERDTPEKIKQKQMTTMVDYCKTLTDNAGFKDSKVSDDFMSKCLVEYKK